MSARVRYRDDKEGPLLSRDVKIFLRLRAQLCQRDHRNPIGLWLTLELGHDLAVTPKVQDDEVRLNADRDRDGVVTSCGGHIEAGASQVLDVSVEIGTVVDE
jgi:hypothetical protein